MSSRARVLIIDDDHEVLDVTRRFLTQRGFKPSVANDWSEAAGQLFSRRPEVVLLDIVMPDLKGDALAEIMQRSLKPPPKILLYSGLPVQELEGLVQRIGAFGYVRKGARPCELLDHLDEAAAAYRASCGDESD